jgi:hypothetical protein
MRIFFVITVLLATAVGQSRMSNAAETAGAAKASLYVLVSGATQTQPCEIRRGQEKSADAAAILKLVAANVSENARVTPGAQEGPDFLGSHLKDRKADNHVIIASYCKIGDVYTITLNGYSWDVPSKLDSGTLTGTFDSLESNSGWKTLFAAATPSNVLAPHIAFIPVAGDTNNVVNPSLLNNLPLTQLATPGPAPTASPAPGMPAIPGTPIEQCLASGDRMLVIGRTLTTSASSEISRASVVGATLKQSAPNPWGTYYTILGTVFGGLYVPNSADVGVDVFTCKSPTDKDVDSEQPEIKQVGGLGHHITGHAVTPALGTNAVAAERAIDLAANDLANQIYCIWLESTDAGYKKESLVTDGFADWCYGGKTKQDAAKKRTSYYNRLASCYPDAIVAQPVALARRQRNIDFPFPTPIVAATATPLPSPTPTPIPSSDTYACHGPP